MLDAAYQEATVPFRLNHRRELIKELSTVVDYKFTLGLIADLLQKIHL